MKNNRNLFLNATVGILKLPSVAFFFYKNAKKQKRFIEQNLLPLLSSFEEINDGSISKADLKKITNYYALGVPGFLGAAFGTLRGKTLFDPERYTMTYLGGISGLLDDLFDDPIKEWSNLEKFVLNPDSLIPKNSFEALGLQLYQKGLSKASKPEKLKQKALEVFQTEKESIFQQGKEISEDKIKELTFLKGGNSFLFYRLCMQHPLDAAEGKLIYQAGGLMQMGNDIFDVWEDVQQEIQTLATCAQDILKLRTAFVKELNLVVVYAHATSYPKKNIKQFINFILLGISRVLVCLDQFEELQDSETSTFQPEKYSRKQLICDMELFKNKKAATKHYLGLRSKYS
ncbi:hypothetical protein [Gillisia sp. JM1]|uniref:hypothetical protein n=1 Tax=Gillisia sp. JM1 TaxID=1283286 RepID=UPI0003FEB5AE|nr:hypothetical protein [Gillisia sp. JM1]